MAQQLFFRVPRLSLALTALAVTGLSCAPAPVANERAELTSGDMSAVCAGAPRVTDRGHLLYGPAGAEMSLPPDYAVECPDLRIRAEGLDVTVQAPDVSRALATFSDDAFVLAYYADLRVRLDGGTLTADPITSLPEGLLEEAKAVTVTVTAEGAQPWTLLQGGVVRPLPQPSTPYLITIRTRNTANPWPTVRVDPTSGTVTATMVR